MKSLLLLLLLTIPCLLRGQALAPEVIVSSGDYIQGSTGSLSFSIGECVIETYAKSSGILTQGFQQGDIAVISFIRNQKLNVDLKAYPVPVRNILNLEMQDLETGFSAILYDIKGTEIMQKEVVSTITEFDLTSLPAGEYILQVFTESGLFVESFKITKH